jgi:hypothetical protein
MPGLVHQPQTTNDDLAGNMPGHSGLGSDDELIPLDEDEDTFGLYPLLFTIHHLIFSFLKDSDPGTADLDSSDLDEEDEESVNIEQGNAEEEIEGDFE